MQACDADANRDEDPYATPLRKRCVTAVSPLLTNHWQHLPHIPHTTHLELALPLQYATPLRTAFRRTHLTPSPLQPPLRSNKTCYEAPGEAAEGPIDENTSPSRHKRFQRRVFGEEGEGASGVQAPVPLRPTRPSAHPRKACPEPQPRPTARPRRDSVEGGGASGSSGSLQPAGELTLAGVFVGLTCGALEHEGHRCTKLNGTPCPIWLSIPAVLQLRLRGPRKTHLHLPRAHPPGADHWAHTLSSPPMARRCGGPHGCGARPCAARGPPCRPGQHQV
jgi:hypothetical protein